MYLSPSTPAASSLNDKADFAEPLILAEHYAFGDQCTDPYDDSFENKTRDHKSRIWYAGDILRGMFLRGWIQAGVFDAYMQLCLQGVCSLDSLATGVRWSSRPEHGTYQSCIFRTLTCFSCLKSEFISKHLLYVGMQEWARWFDYSAPLWWLSTMIGRSCIDGQEVFCVLRTIEQLGLTDDAFLNERMQEYAQHHEEWKSDSNLNQSNGPGPTSGKFACWLPESGQRNPIKTIRCCRHGNITSLFRASPDDRKAVLRLL